jgi:arylsulfatase A-like enzyme
MVRAPGRPAARVDTLARQIDIVPTILRRLGLAVPRGVEGVALAPIVEEGSAPAEVFSATSLGTREALALTTPGWKVVQGTRGPRAAPELYDLANDVDERHDLAASRPILLGYARQRLTEWAASAAPEGELGALAPIDAGAYERLKALGYLAR